MADAAALADFLHVKESKVPGEPETLGNAKVEMVNLARRSRRTSIRTDMVPREGSGRSVGPAYASRLIEFVNKRWRPPVAGDCSHSLARAISCLKRLIDSNSRC